jgi:Na+/proline symporter|tara:strand:- start:402 stop:605 length:204 start_codon:yes stop_codon:yes gene_type:complete
MKEKLTSRKLWVAIGGLLTVAATDWLNLSPELTSQLVGAIMIIVPAYIGGQGIVDAMKEYASAAKKK